MPLKLNPTTGQLDIVPVQVPNNTMPSYTSAQKNALIVPAGTIVFDSDTGQLNYWDGTHWVSF